VPANVLGIGPDGAQVYGLHTGLLTWTEALGDAAWVRAGLSGATAPSLDSSNAVAAPDGSMVAERFTFPAVTGAGISRVLQGTTTTVTGKTLGGYVWLRADSPCAVEVAIDETVAATTLASSGRVTATPTYQRVFVTGAGGAATGFARFGVRRSAAYLGDYAGTCTVDVTWAGLWEGAIAYPYNRADATPWLQPGTAITATLPAGSKWLAYWLNGTRQTYDVSALSGSFTLGTGGPLGALDGSLREFLFCPDPGAENCR
jgi:hypothetical protein